MILKELIKWLEEQDQHLVIRDGFGPPHSYRGNYVELGFEPVEKTSFGEMLTHAKSAMGATFLGWKGGNYAMDEYTDCYISEEGGYGEPITSAHLRLWLLTAERCE